MSAILYENKSEPLMAQHIDCLWHITWWRNLNTGGRHHFIKNALLTNKLIMKHWSFDYYMFIISIEYLVTWDMITLISLFDICAIDGQKLDIYIKIRISWLVTIIGVVIEIKLTKCWMRPYTMHETLGLLLFWALIRFRASQPRL